MTRLILFALALVVSSAVAVRLFNRWSENIIEPEDITVNDFAGDDGEPETLRQFDKAAISRRRFTDE